MPISHYSTSTSTFFKGINLKLKWKTSCFRSAPKIFERQLLNQDTAPSFLFFLLFPLLCWGFLNDSAVGLHQGCLQGCAILSFNLLLLRLSSVRQASLIFMDNTACDINLASFFRTDTRTNVKLYLYLENFLDIFWPCNVQLQIILMWYNLPLQHDGIFCVCVVCSVFGTQLFVVEGVSIYNLMFQHLTNSTN